MKLIFVMFLIYVGYKLISPPRISSREDDFDDYEDISEYEDLEQ